MPDTESPVFSFVLPVHNESGNIAELYRRLSYVIEELGEPGEMIFVDDGSFDDSLDAMQRLREGDERVKIVAFSRNFGHQAAITAGLDVASGKAIVVMDSDLQHPPEVIPKMVSCWREGFEVISAVPVDRRGDSLFKRLTARAFYWLLRRLAHTEMSPTMGDFRLVDRKALEAFNSMRESTRYLRGMFSWLGFRQTAVPYDYQSRQAGDPKYHFRRMLALGINGIVSFSNAPLELALHIGFVVAGLSFAAGIADIVAKILAVDTVPGWLSIAIMVSFLGGMQLVVLGVIGIYISRIYEEVKNRPLYIVRELQGIEANKASPDRIYIYGS